MSQLSEYYTKNHDVNPYTMGSVKNTSRVTYIQEFIQQFTPKSGKILDVGCGDGYLEDSLPGYQWTGLDINEQTKAIKHDIEQAPYPVTGQFDTIICSEVLEHVYDPLKVTQEIHRLLKSDGTYIVSTPNFYWLQNYLDNFENVEFDLTKSWTKEHIHHYSMFSHSQILDKAGFEVYGYIGADSHYGDLFHSATNFLFNWLVNNHDKDLVKSEQLAYRLLGGMFKDHSHTLVIVAKKKI